MKFSCLLFCLVFTVASCYELVYQWTVVDYEFKSPEMRKEYSNSQRYIPENNVITGMKIFRDSLYLSVPRRELGVPSTLNVVRRASQDRSPKLNPFPSWDMQEINNCNSFQSVQSMEIDAENRMWIIDTGRIGNYKEYQNCPAKLVIYDIVHQHIIRSFNFPEDIVSRSNSLLNEIVVDCPAIERISGSTTYSSNGSSSSTAYSSSYSSSSTPSINDCYAYISDSGMSSLVVYHFGDNKAWKIHDPSMDAGEGDVQHITILNNTLRFNTSIYGLALSPVSHYNRTIYYAPLMSLNLYSLNTSHLKARSEDIPNSVHTIGTKPSQSAAMTMDNNGVLYFGSLKENAVYKWISNTSFAESERIIRNDTDIQWLNAFAFDNESPGFLYILSNKMVPIYPPLDTSVVNFRIIRIRVDSSSYMIAKKEIIVNFGLPHDFTPTLKTTMRPPRHNSATQTSAITNIFTDVICLLLTLSPFLAQFI